MSTQRAPAVIAHRGASADAPEHTAEAYDLALALGAEWLELDVRPMADGTPLVVHDATLQRTCGDPRAVRDLRPADLADLDPLTRLLRLEEVLERHGAAARYLVELKEPGPEDARRALDVVDRHGLRAHVALQSFDHAALRAARALDPDVALGALYLPRLPGRSIRAHLPRVARWATAIAPCATSVDASVVGAAHARGLAVHAYTVNEPAEMQRLLGLGVDGLITDVPGVAWGQVAGPVAALAA